MALPQDDIRRLGDELYGALRERRTVPPLTGRVAGIGVDDSYAISLHMLRLREQAGERLVGKKIGVTSKPVQDMLDVRTPDFGFLTDVMAYASGAEMPISTRLIQPRAEGELAFRLARGLRGPGVTEADVLAATECVMPCFEVVDSRIEAWKIRYEDTVADNASSGLYVLGDEADPRAVDLANAEMVVEKNGAFLSRGTGREALTGSPRLGSPAACVAWLANTLAGYGIGLEAGEVVLSGSLVPLEPVVAGDEMRVTVEGIGAAWVRFV
jgi:2-oxopent-4-enoate/cis-2-oxohex-4-enoate hydratase